MGSETMVFNHRQGVVLDDIARFWKADKPAGTEPIPCIFFVDSRGDSFHVTYSRSDKGVALRDSEFSELVRRL